MNPISAARFPKCVPAGSSFSIASIVHRVWRFRADRNAASHSAAISDMVMPGRIVLRIQAPSLCEFVPGPGLITAPA